LPSFSRSQNTFSINLNKNSGLPSSIVYDFYQDSKGFIWVATNGGLSKYDGFEFQTYSSAEQSSLAGSAIKEDKYGRIWYQNFDGYLFYIKDEKLNILKQNRPGEYVPFGIVGDFLFVVQHQGVDVFDLQTLQLVTTITVDASNIIGSTVLDQSYYFIAENKVFKIGVDFKLTQSDYFEKKGIRINHINNDGQNIFLGYKNTNNHVLYFISPQLQYIREKQYPSKGGVIATQFLDKKYWLYTNNGFYVYNKSGDVVLSNLHLDLDSSINKCMIDKNQNHWFSSLKDGLYIISDFNSKVYSYKSKDLMKIVDKNNNFLISTLNGEVVQTDASFVNYKTDLNFKNNNNIIHWMYDKQDDLLFYTTPLGFHISHKDKVIYFEEIAVKDVLRLDEKYFAVATSGFVMLLKNPLLKKESSYSKWDAIYKNKRVFHYKNLATLLSNVRAKSIDFYKDSNSFIVATNVGVFIFDTLKYSNLLVKGNPFYASDVYSYSNKIYLLDNVGNLTVVSPSGDINILNDDIGVPLNGIKMIKRFDNILYVVGAGRVYEYDLTRINNSVYSYNTNTLSITDLYRTDELLVLVAEKQIVTINLKNKSVQKVNSQFHFNNVYVGSEKFDQRMLSNLKHFQNSIRITFSVIDFGNRIEPNISYRLNDGEWVKLTVGSREIQLLSLTAGQYRLDVQMEGRVLQEHIVFTISRPFYMEWWFVNLIVFGVIAVVLSIYLWRMKLMRIKIHHLNRRILLENELRTSILTSIKAQMNPHFFYNALNTIQSYIFSNDRYSATTYLSKFSKLTRMILEMSDQPRIKLEDEITALTLYLELEQMRFHTGFHFQIILMPKMDIRLIEIPSMLIQPYVENAVKHGLLHKIEGEKKMIVSFHEEGEFVRVIVDDNGIGRKKSEEINKQRLDKPKSFGTEFTKKRLELLNYNQNVVSVQYEDKVDEKNQPLGTKVTIFISKK
jgi:two-component sensor histidine kinase